METLTFTLGAFLEHLRTDATPLVVRRYGAPEWGDEALHRDVFTHDPALYALLALIESTTDAQRMRILYQTLERSRVGMDPTAARTLDRVTALLLAVLPADSVVTVFLALRRARANHKHTAHTILHYILNHPHLDKLVQRRRPAVQDVLEHALGKDTSRGAIRHMSEPGEGAAYAQRHLLRRARDPERARTALAGLYTQRTSTALAPTGTEVQYTQAHAPYRARLERRAEVPKTVTATNRGDIAATLFHLYRGGPSPDLEAAAEQYVKDAAARLPRFEGRLALVLDASASTRSYGEREYAALAQSVALTRVLAHNCAELVIYPGPQGAAGTGLLPQPQGATDLAGPLLDALGSQPDVVAIISDGYENVYAGDLARVAASLPGAGVQTPVVFCHSKFTGQDDLTYRQPAPNLPQLAFWHEADFEEVLLRLFSLAWDTTGIQAFLHEKLEELEKEGPLWTTMR